MKPDALTAAELQAITGKRTPRQQVSRLVVMGVPFRFGGGIVEVKRAVAEELPQWREASMGENGKLKLAGKNGGHGLRIGQRETYCDPSF